MTLFYRTVLLASVAVFTSDGLYCQARAILETFSIQPSAATDSRSPIRVSADTIQAANATLRQLIAYAYDLQEIQILGPEWIETQGYAISAKADRAVEVPEMRLLLQRLLKDRFELKVHSENREVPGYWLLVSENGPKLQPFNEHASSDISSGRVKFRPGYGAMFTNKDLPAFAERLSRGIGAPVVDKTDIKGQYWFQVEWKADGDVRGAPAKSSYQP